MDDSSSDHDFGSYQSSPTDNSPSKNRRSAPIPIGEADGGVSDWMKQLKAELKHKEETIASLKQQNDILTRKLVVNTSRFGQIEVGLVYHPVAAKLEIHCCNAKGIQAVNKLNNLSDPFVKVKVWKTSEGGSPKSNKAMPTWKFQTEVIWECLEPVWDQM